jgi:glycosyltransferase involved in cell wall biosynthesis
MPWKGFEMLIELMPELLKINPNFKLIILGKGPMFEELKAQSLKLKVDDKLEIKAVDSETRDHYLKAAMMFVLNTGYEGLPHTVLEAMTAGVPVITTTAGGNPEVVKDGETGLLVEYNNKEQLKEAILKLWRNRELREKLVKNARQELHKFSFKEMIEKTLKVLKR